MSNATSYRSILDGLSTAFDQPIASAMEIDAVATLALIGTKLVRTSLVLSSLVEKRNRLIMEAHDAGMSNREVAKLAGLSHTQIARIIDQRTQA